MSTRAEIAVLVSGGLDSGALVAHALRQGVRVLPIYIRQGLRWEKEELRALKRFLHALKRPALRSVVVLELPMGDLYGARHWSARGRQVPGQRSLDHAVYLEGRNLTLIVKAAVLCARRQVTRLWLGSLSGNPFPDATRTFFRMWGRVLSMGLGHRLRLETPFRSTQKAEVIRRHADAPLHLTFSCIAPRRGKHCGRCNKCGERRRAFRQAGVRDRTRYA